MEALPQALTIFLAMLVCLSFHEAAHAFVAFMLGDPTAKSEGRLSLNPLVHADMLGTIILPLMGALLRFPVLGWAKPVPIDPRYFRNPKRDSILVALAGPAANLLFCAFCIVLLIVYESKLTAFLPPESFFFPLVKLVHMAVFMNAILAFFNLIPLPPLDGAALLRLVLPDDMADSFERMAGQYGFIILLVLLATGSLGWVHQFALKYVSVVEGLVQKVLSPSLA